MSIPNKIWTVYRDGERWTVHARHLAGALSKASLQTDPMSGRQFVDAGTRRVECEPPTIDVDGELPILLRYWACNASVEAVYLHGREQGSDPSESEDEGVGEVVQLVNVASIDHAFACRVLERSREMLEKLRRDTEAEIVRDADGHPIAVQCFRSGAKGLSVRAELSRSRHGKLDSNGFIEWSHTINMHYALDALRDKGLIKWPRKTTEQEKARVLAGIIHNVELAEVVKDFETLVAETSAVCEMLVPSPKRVSELNETELRERQAQLEAELAELSPTTTARYPIIEQIDRVKQRLDVFDSIREHGFDVGTVIEVSPAPWQEDKTVRRGRVTEVRVEHKPTYFGREPETQHRRVIEFFDGSDSIQPEVDRLRLVTA